LVCQTSPQVRKYHTIGAEDDPVGSVLASDHNLGSVSGLDVPLSDLEPIVPYAFRYCVLAALHSDYSFTSQCYCSARAFGNVIQHNESQTNNIVLGQVSLEGSVLVVFRVRRQFTVTSTYVVENLLDVSLDVVVDSVQQIIDLLLVGDVVGDVVVDLVVDEIVDSDSIQLINGTIDVRSSEGIIGRGKDDETSSRNLVSDAIAKLPKVIAIPSGVSEVLASICNSQWTKNEIAILEGVTYDNAIIADLGKAIDNIIDITKANEIINTVIQELIGIIIELIESILNVVEVVLKLPIVEGVVKLLDVGCQLSDKSTISSLKLAVVTVDTIDTVDTVGDIIEITVGVLGQIVDDVVQLVDQLIDRLKLVFEFIQEWVEPGDLDDSAKVTESINVEPSTDNLRNREKINLRWLFRIRGILGWLLGKRGALGWLLGIRGFLRWLLGRRGMRRDGMSRRMRRWLKGRMIRRMRCWLEGGMPGWFVRRPAGWRGSRTRVSRMRRWLGRWMGVGGLVCRMRRWVR